MVQTSAGGPTTSPLITSGASTVSRKEDTISINRGKRVDSNTEDPRLTHVLQSSCPRVLLLEAERVEALSAPKVHDLDGVEIGHHDVVWLQVQVEDTPPVEVLHSLQYLHQVAHDVILSVAESFRSRDAYLSLNRQEDPPGFKRKLTATPALTCR